MRIFKSFPQSLLHSTLKQLVQLRNDYWFGKCTCIIFLKQNDALIPNEDRLH